MANMVRAAVQVGPRRLEMREFPRPSVGADDAIIRVEANGICGSDIEIYADESGRRSAPFIPGHEPMGIVDEIGDVAAERWGVQVGDRIAMEVVVPCRTCADCLGGRYQACRFKGNGHGITPVDVAPSLYGGFAEYMYVQPSAVVHRIDATLPVEVAAMFNPLGAGVRWALDIGGVGMGDVFVVLGAGQRGIFAALAAKSVGAATVIVTGLERDAHKLAAARELGADHTVVVDGDDAVDIVSFVEEVTDGRMADVALDVTPMAGGPVSDALRSVRHGGRVVLAGLKGGREIPINTDLFVNRALTVRGAFGVDAPSMDNAIRLLESRRFDVGALHTHTFDLDHVGDAIDILGPNSADRSAIHVTVQP